MPNNNQWNKHWMEIALVTAKLSKDPSTQVGAVIVTLDNRQCSTGYNGFARGIDETFEEWNTREIKLEMVIHAEENAILNCPFEKKDTKIYVTHKPCHKCLIKMVQVGIKEIYYLHDYKKLGCQEIWEKHAKQIEKIEQLFI